MNFLLESCFIHHPRPLGLHALKLRFALIAMYDAYRNRQPVDAPRPYGCRTSSIDVRRMIGLDAARDARTLRRAVAELQDDPAYQWIRVSDDGRHLSFALDPAICEIAHMPRYALIQYEDFQSPATIVDFHLSMRNAEVRKMKAPASDVPASGAAAMAGPGKRADPAWARRTLLPALRRLAKNVGGPVFLGAVWPADPAMAPSMRFRFGGPKTTWTPKALRRVYPDEHAWLVTAERAERLNRPRITPVYAR